jgi:hypothetical protein
MVVGFNEVEVALGTWESALACCTGYGSTNARSQRGRNPAHPYGFAQQPEETNDRNSKGRLRV